MIERNYQEGQSASGSKVTFVVLVYNNDNYIERLLYSLLNHTEQFIEVIIHDDGSTDRSAERIARFFNENSDKLKGWTVIYSGENRGINASLLKVAEAVKTEWIKCIAGDDEFTAGAVDKYCELAREYDVSRTMIQAEMVLVDTESDIIGYKRAIRSWIYQSRLLRSVNLYVNSINAPTVMIGKNNLIEALQSTSVKNAEDWPILKTAIVKNLKIQSIPAALVNYRIHQGSLSFFYHSEKSGINNAQKMVHMILKENMRVSSDIFSKFGIYMQIRANAARTPMQRRIINLGKMLNIQFILFKIVSLL